MPGQSEEAKRRRETRLRQPARISFLEKLSESGEWREKIQGLEDEPLAKLLIAGVKGLRQDAEKPGGIVYSRQSGSTDHIGKRRLQDRVREHLFPVLKALPIDIRMIESLKLLDPTDYLRIEKEIEESSEIFWDHWSYTERRVADSLFHVIRAIERLHKALSTPVRFCRICPRRTVDETSDFCKEHHPKMSPSGYMAGRRRSPTSPWKKEIALMSLWHAMGKPSLKVIDSSGGNESEKLNHFLRSSWPETKTVFLESLKTELPLTYKKIFGTIKKADSWKEAINQMGECLEDRPPETEDSTIVFSWLRALELCFNSELETKQTKSDKVKEMLLKGYKQSEVVRELGVSRQLVSRIARQISRLS